MPISKIIKRAYQVISLAIMFVVLDCVFGFLLQPVWYSNYFKKDVNMISKKKQDVEMLFVGASRTYRTFDPRIFERELGMQNVLNAASSGQPISGTYYEVCELIDKFHPKYIVLGVTFDQITGEDENLQSRLILRDRMMNQRYKFDFSVKRFKIDEWKYLLNSYRFRDNLTLNLIDYNISKKIDLNLNGYIPDTSAEAYYAYKGFEYTNASISEGNMKLAGASAYDYNNISKIKLEYLNKIVKKCKSSDIDLFLVTGPASMAKLYEVKNYQKAVDYYKTYASNNGLFYDNLNYIRDREDILSDDHMSDCGHINGRGAEIISKVYAHILSDEIHGINTDGYFYSSLDELKKDVKRIVAVDSQISVSENRILVRAGSLHNIDIFPEYKILVAHDGGKDEVFSEYSEKTEYSIPMLDGCSDYVVTVKARGNIKGETVAYQSYNINDIEADNGNTSDDER